MNTMDAIRNRKSFRGPFAETPVKREDLKELLEAGYLAPSGCNLQSTRFIGIDDQTLLEKLGDIFGYDWAKKAPAAILIITAPALSQNGVSYHIQDYSAAAENICLTATDKGLGTVWIQGQIEGEKSKQMGALLGVPEDLTIVIYLPIGYPAKPGSSPKKKPMEERAWLNSYGKPDTPAGNTP